MNYLLQLQPELALGHPEKKRKKDELEVMSVCANRQYAKLSIYKKQDYKPIEVREIVKNTTDDVEASPQQH